MNTIKAFNTVLLGLLTAAFALSSSAAFAAPGEIAVIVKTTNSNYWQDVKKGATASAADQMGIVNSSATTWASGISVSATNQPYWAA